MLPLPMLTPRHLTDFKVTPTVRTLPYYQMVMEALKDTPTAASMNAGKGLDVATLKALLCVLSFAGQWEIDKEVQEVHGVTAWECLQLKQSPYYIPYGVYVVWVLNSAVEGILKR